MLSHFVTTPEWEEVKQYLKNEFIDKPLDIKVEGKSCELIALEVRASQIATEKIIKAIKKLEAMKVTLVDEKPFR